MHQAASPSSVFSQHLQNKVLNDARCDVLEATQGAKTAAITTFTIMTTVPSCGYENVLVGKEA